MLILIFSLILLNFLFLSFEYISFRLNGDGINDSVFYHLMNPLEGAGIEDFKLEILIFLSTLFIIFFVFFLLKKVKLKLKYNLLIILFLTGCLFFNVGFNKTYKHVKYYFSTEIKKPVDYLEFESEMVGQRNIFFIYLESLENTYTDERVFPGLTPNINLYKNDGLVFENVEMPTGSEWTIAGMVASQCGIPLVTSAGSGNSLGQKQKFLPKANCLGDILKNHGYKNYYYGGADTKFAGKKNFYANHGFDEIHGLNELKEREEVSAQSAWGIYDDEFFKIIQNDFEKLDKKQKYAWFALNLDTHHPFGHASPSCKDVKYGNGEIKILNAVHCTDILLKNLVESIKKNDPDVIIVIASDHLAMPNDARYILLQQNRKNLFLVLNSQKTAENIKSVATTYDIGPTVLSLMGVENEGLGWGRNLLTSFSLRNNFSNIKEFNEYVKFYRNFNQSFHGYSDAFQSLKKQDEHFLLNGERVDAPFAIKINKNKYIEDIFFPGEEGFEKYLKNVVGSSEESNIIFVDECKKINLYIKSNRTCYLINRNSWVMDKGGFFNDDVEIDENFEIKSWNEFEKIGSDLNKYIYQDVSVVYTDEDIKMDSNVFGGGGSFIKTSEALVANDRGIGFYFIDKNGGIENLDFKDFCNDEEIPIPSDNLFEFITGNKYKMGNFVYIVHDTAWCDHGKYLKFVENLNANFDIGLKDIGFRESAIFIKNEKEMIFEKSNKRVLVLPTNSN